MQLKDIDQQAFEIEEKLRLKKRYKSHLTMLEEIIAEQTDRRQELQKRMEKERRDVEELESQTFGNAMMALFGKRKERLTKERQEYLEASANLDKLEGDLKNCTIRRDEVRNTLAQYEDLEERYEDLLRERHGLLILEKDQSNDAFRTLLENAHKLRQFLNELRDTITALGHFIDMSNKLRQELVNLQVWGVFKDPDLGTRDTLDYHQKSLVNALKALQEYEQFDLDLSQYAKWDGLSMEALVSAMVERGIPETLQRLDQLMASLVNLQESLITHYKTDGERFHRYEKELDDIIEAHESKE